MAKPLYKIKCVDKQGESADIYILPLRELDEAQRFKHLLESLDQPKYEFQIEKVAYG